ncbi:MAG: glycoside hydrolase family 3 C-terminal domain-containing protein [Muribaculaceae bacterium]|nr:glycoside hydrolase family 3 C-terminal domain-containing protein [Muribaculaceae bacterium]
MKSIYPLIIAAVAATSASAETPLYLNPDAPIEDRVEDALSRMTLEEKVALCHAQSKFSSAGVPRLGIPELWMSDGPHGVRPEINWNDWGHARWTNDSCTAFPALTALAATWNPALSAAYGKNVGEEARYREKDVLLGPGVNIYRTPLNGRNFEYMGEDPWLASVMVVPYVQELQKNGVAACVKHFALNNQERWRGNINVDVSDRALYEIYLPAFKAAVQQGGAWTVMGAYNKVWNQHCCHNQRLLEDILRGEWGFDGAVITDWGGAHDTREAALNGLDIEMGSFTNGLTSESEFTYDDYYLARPFLELIRKGEVPESTADDKARRILRLIFRTAMNTRKPFGSLHSPEHYAAAKAIGDESIVLLKNSGILPLDPAAGKRILVVGDNATRVLTNGGGSSELKVKDYISPLDGITAVFGADNVDYARGYAAGPPMYDRDEPVPASVQDSLRAEAVALAAGADVVIYVGGLNKNAFQDCEGQDRTGYGLPFGQDELIEALVKANPNIVIANISGNAYAMPWADNVPAILHSSYLGTMGGASIADVLAGRVNPSGKLPYSIPVRLEDCAAHSFGVDSYPGVESESGDVLFGVCAPQQRYEEDLLVGYRWHDTKKVPARYAFGHGLSYTAFAYGKPVLSAKEMTAEGDKLTVTVPVTNTGSREGAEVVQLYVGDDKASVLRPVKELKGFEKVTLAPGETRDVTFTVTPEMLAFFDAGAHAWRTEPGTFTLYLGGSSAVTPAKAKFKLK